MLKREGRGKLGKEEREKVSKRRDID